MGAFHQRFAPVPDYGFVHITAAATLQPVGGIVNTSSPTSITPGTQSVQVASLSNITPQMQLQFANGNGVAELVPVSGINTAATSITATFAQSHSGAYNIFSSKGTFLGPVFFNSLGSGCTLQIWDGHPQMAAGAKLFASIPLVAGLEDKMYGNRLGRGLFYTLIVGSQAPDITLSYIDMGN